MAEKSGQLEKIEFIFYEDEANPGVGIKYKPAYNPTSFSVSHSSGYDPSKKTPEGDMNKKFTQLNPRSVSLELFFDGTNTSPTAGTVALGAGTSLTPDVMALGVNSVEGQIRTFLNLAYKINKTKHVPRFVQIGWGHFLLTGVLASANVTYKMFNPDGTPLRATMSITINESIPDKLWKPENMLLSPDLSKARIVEEGDTLPLLCYKEYEDASLYPKIAAVNNLKNYRKLKQGMELLFPPIDNLA